MKRLLCVAGLLTLAAIATSKIPQTLAATAAIPAVKGFSTFSTAGKKVKAVTDHDTLNFGTVPVAQSQVTGLTTALDAKLSPSGTAAQATRLAGTPTLCPPGYATRGGTAFGNATGCFLPAGGGDVSGKLDTSVFNAYTSANLTRQPIIHSFSHYSSGGADRIPPGNSSRNGLLSSIQAVQIASPAQHSPIAVGKSTKLVLVGDSLTKGTINGTTGWGPVVFGNLSSAYTVTGWTFANDGHDGVDTKQEISDYWQTEAVDANADIYWIMLGTNDSVPEGKFHHTPIDLYRANIRKMAVDILSKDLRTGRNGGRPKVLFGIPPHIYEGASGHTGTFDDYTNASLTNYVTALREELDSLGLPYVDLWNATIPLNSTYYQTDGVHLTDTGYGVVAGLVYSAIQAMIDTDGCVTPTDTPYQDFMVQSTNATTTTAHFLTKDIAGQERFKILNNGGWSSYLSTNKYVGASQGGNTPFMEFRNYGATGTFAAPETIADDALFGRFFFEAYDGAATPALNLGNYFGYRVKGTPSAGTVPGQFEIFTGGTKRMTVHADGVGVNTAAPAGLLHVHGNGTTTGVALTTTDSADQSRFNLLDNGKLESYLGTNKYFGVYQGGNTPFIELRNYGNSGTFAAPSAMLAGNLLGRIFFEGYDAVPSLKANNYIGMLSKTDADIGSLYGQFEVITDGVQRLTAHSSGVGVNTAAPTAQLHIKGTGTTTAVAARTTDSADQIRFSVLDNGSLSTFMSTNKYFGVTQGGGTAYAEFRNYGTGGTFTVPVTIGNTDLMMRIFAEGYDATATPALNTGNHIDIRNNGAATSGSIPGKFGVTLAGAYRLEVLADGRVRHSTFYTPASSSATCTVGDFAMDASYYYLCTATDTWKRTSTGSTW